MRFLSLAKMPFSLGLVAACSIANTFAQEVRKVIPAAVRPGMTNQVTLEGSSLDQVTEIWSGFGGFSSLAGTTNAARLKVDMACPAQTPLGVYPFQVAGYKGASRTMFIMVDDLETHPLSPNARTLLTAQNIQAPSALEGWVAQDEFCFFKWNAKGGERYQVEILAQRMGSTLDPVLHILDAEGQTLISSYDEPGLAGDSSVSFVAPRSGTYFIKLHDTAFGGGENYWFRMRVGRFPLATLTYPLSATVDQAKDLKLKGPLVKNAAVTQLPWRPGEGYATVAFQEDSALSNRSFVRIHAFDRLNLMEQEPNNLPMEAAEIALPVVLQGKLENGGDVDCFWFRLKQGERINVYSKTRSLGAPCDLYLQLFHDSNSVSESDPSNPNEAQLTYQAKADGEYMLKVQEITGGSNELFLYHIEIFKAKTGFQLSSDNDLLTIAPAKSGTLKISVTRTGEAAPLKLNIHGLGEGVVLQNNIIPADKNETELKFTLSPEWRIGQLLHFKISGHINEPGADSSSRYASTREAWRKSHPLTLYPPPGVDGLFTLAIIKE